MKKYGLFGFLGLAGLSAVLALPARAEDSPQVFISEINWAGSEKSTADEWLELVNLGNQPVDLSHYVLTGVATGGQAIEIAEGTALAPGKTLLVSNHAANDPKSTLLISPNLVTTAISLPNSALDILLTTPAGLVIDSYTDTGNLEFGSSKPAVSIERNLTTMAWQSSSQNLGLASNEQFGTPGSVSLPSPQVTTPPVLPLLGEVAQTPVQVVVEPTPVVETPVVVEPEPVVVLPPVEPTPEPAVINIPEPTPLPLPCTQVVLESELPIASSWPTQTPQIQVESTTSTWAEPSSAPTSNPGIQPIAPNDLIINELVSDPIDGVEWLEILNDSSAQIDLTNSTLKDAGNHVTDLPTQTLNAGDLIVVENPNGNLNNSGDTITLINSSGTTIDTITYGTAEMPAPKDGESLARTSDGDWLITDATRDTPNVFPVPEAGPSPAPTREDSNETSYDQTTNQSHPAVSDSGTPTEPVATHNNSQPAGAEPIQRIVAIAQSVTESVNASTPAKKSSSAKSKAATELTVVTGTVVALPNTFGKQTMFLDGHEIYFNAATWPDIQLGDVLQISGTPSSNEGVERLKVKVATDIVVTGHVESAPTPIAGAELASSPHGLLVSISGRVVGKDGDKLALIADDGTAVTIVAYKKTGVSWKSMQSGTAIMTGVVRMTDDGPRIYVRSTDDVRITPDAAITPTVPGSKPKTTTSPLVGGGLLTGSLGALMTWYAKSRNLLSWLPF